MSCDAQRISIYPPCGAVIPIVVRRLARARINVRLSNPILVRCDGQRRTSSERGLPGDSLWRSLKDFRATFP